MVHLRITFASQVSRINPQAGGSVRWLKSLEIYRFFSASGKAGALGIHCTRTWAVLNREYGSRIKRITEDIYDSGLGTSRLGITVPSARA